MDLQIVSTLSNLVFNSISDFIEHFSFPNYLIF
jgi:hypothetical protein